LLNSVYSYNTAPSSEIFQFFSPVEPLSSLIGEDPNGVWTLRVQKKYWIGSGELILWSIIFDVDRPTVYVGTSTDRFAEVHAPVFYTAKSNEGLSTNEKEIGEVFLRNTEAQLTFSSKFVGEITEVTLRNPSPDGWKPEYVVIQSSLFYFNRWLKQSGTPSLTIKRSYLWGFNFMGNVENPANFQLQVIGSKSTSPIITVRPEGNYFSISKGYNVGEIQSILVKYVSSKRVSVYGIYMFDGPTFLYFPIEVRMGGFLSTPIKIDRW